MVKNGGPCRRENRPSIGVLMLLVAGAALGIWQVAEEVRRVAFTGFRDDLLGYRDWSVAGTLVLVFLLGGLSLVGPPLLLISAPRSSWGAGRLLWFAQGSASWLFWPPIVYRLVSRAPMGLSVACYYYGTPLISVFVMLALLSGGRLNRRHRRQIARSWQETFGLLLGLLWACTGLYFIALLYRRDFFSK